MLVGLTGIGKTALAARLLTDRTLHPALPIQTVVSLDRTTQL
jgi:signal recognition particle GTPase